MKWRPKKGWVNPYTELNEDAPEYLQNTIIETPRDLFLMQKGQAESFEAGADAMQEALKAQGRYCRLHRTFKPPGYKQPIRAPGWVVFIPAQTEGDKGGEV